MDLKIAGKTALITGGSKGIGRATADVFAAEGCNVIIVSRTAEALAQVKAAIAQKSNVRVDTVAADLSDSKNVDGLAQDFPDIDILVTDLFLTAESERTENVKDAEGLRLIERCRERFPRSRIVAITGRSGVGTELGGSALQAGADDFISAQWRYIDLVKLLEHKLRIFDWVLRHTTEPTLS